MDEQQLIDLASRYVSGSATAEEIELLNSLLQDPRHAELFRKINTTWLDAGKAGVRADFDPKRGLDTLGEKLKKHEPAFSWGQKRGRTKNNIPAYAYVGIAASIVVIFLVSGIAMYLSNSASPIAAIDWYEKSARAGEKVIVDLPDGSRITLNEESKMSYTSEFNVSSREIFLEGEAFFDVTNDPVKPFIIHSGVVQTMDLGTKFNISNYPADRTITISLEEGCIEVTPNGNGRRNGGIVLSPLQEFVFDKQTGRSTVGAFDPKTVSGWKTDPVIGSKK